MAKSAREICSLFTTTSTLPRHTLHITQCNDLCVGRLSSSLFAACCINEIFIFVLKLEGEFEKQPLEIESRYYKIISQGARAVHIFDLAKATEMSQRISKIFLRVHQQHAIVRKEHKHHKVGFNRNHISFLIFWIKWNREKIEKNPKDIFVLLKYCCIERIFHRRCS